MLITKTVLIAITLSLLSCATGNSSVGAPNPYLRGEGAWGNLPEGRSWGAASAIQYAGNDRVWVADRCGGNRGPGSCEDLTDVDPIFLMDLEGRSEEHHV